jgi:hypothetical protein
MHPWFVPSNNQVKHIFFFICIPQEMLQGQTYAVSFSLNLSVLWANNVRSLSETSNDHAFCSMPNNGNILVQLLHCLLSSCQLESTLPPPAQLLVSQFQQGDLVGHHLQCSNIFERIFWPSCEPFYTTNTSDSKQGTYLCECPLHWVLLPIKAQWNSVLR